jgi:putative nucleotidyltransferase with HDIG domain
MAATASQTDPNKTIEQLLRRAQKISTLPHIALRLIELANGADTSAADLKAALETDAPLSAQVLRHVNSSAFGLRTRVTNLRVAISYVGMKQIRNMAIAASVSDIFKSDERIGSYQRSALWKHLVAVSLCARLLAMRQRLPNFEDAFLAGLLHDIGIILEDQFVHDRFRNAMVACTDSRSTLVEIERQELGFDHASLGCRFAESWRMPNVICAAIRYHHDSSAYTGPEAPIVWCVEVANLLCTIQGIPSVGVNLLRPTRHAIDSLGLSKQDLLVLGADVEAEIATHKHLLA